MDAILNFIQNSWHWILIAIVAIIILLKFIPRYKIAPPDTALIISGLIRRNYKVRNSDGTVSAKKFGYRIIRGGATFYIPAIERIDQLDMCLNQVDIRTAQPVPTRPAGYVPEPGGYPHGAAGAYQGIYFRAGGRRGEHQDRFR